jgi:aerobic-type carbon monoxide dehydrogenase small subunit (CoxS/CutS family)
MTSKLKIKANGLVHDVTASLDTPLLYVMHNELQLHGPRFGCGRTAPMTPARVRATLKAAGAV